MADEPSGTEQPTEVPPTDVPADARGAPPAGRGPLGGAGLARVVLAVNGLLWALVGVGGLLMPDDLADMVDFALTTALARLEFRATYGGMAIALGGLHLVALLRSRWLAPGVAASTLLVAGLLGGRVLSLVVDGFSGVTASLLVGGELALFVLGLVALARLARDGARARRERGSSAASRPGTTR